MGFLAMIAAPGFCYFKIKKIANRANEEAQFLTASSSVGSFSNIAESLPNADRLTL